MMYYVYLLRSEVDGTYYTGMAKDTSARLEEHNKGRSRYTKSRIPWRLIYSEGPFATATARKREKQMKSTEEKQKILSRL
jgi:putative endonuclease